MTARDVNSVNPPTLAEVVKERDSLRTAIAAALTFGYAGNFRECRAVLVAALDGTSEVGGGGNG